MSRHSGECNSPPRYRTAKPQFRGQNSGLPGAVYYPGTSHTETIGNIVKKLITTFLSLALASWVACSTASGPDEATTAIRQAVERHLAARTDLDPANLRVVVEKVSYEGEQAEAAVTIVARNDPEAKMEMIYRLRKTADGWQVESPQDSGGHGGMAPAPQQEESDSGLPPGHPPVGGSQGSGSSEMPEGHPPVTEQ